MPTNFLEASGTNGFIASPFNLLSTELNALGIAATVISSVGGTAGVFNQTNFVNAIWGNIWFIAGGAITPTAGGFLAGWFVQSSDGGTTFEKNVGTTIGLPRSPDFTIPLWVSAYAANDISFASGFVKLPWASTKVLLLNSSGAALPATLNIIKCAPVAIQY